MTSKGARGGLGNLLAPENLPAVLVVAGAGCVLGGLAQRATRSTRGLTAG